MTEHDDAFGKRADPAPGPPGTIADHHTRLKHVRDLDECKRLLQQCREHCYGLEQEIATTGYGQEVVLRRELRHHRAETERLRELLKMYGDHTYHCAVRYAVHHVCGCGWLKHEAEFRS